MARLNGNQSVTTKSGPGLSKASLIEHQRALMALEADLAASRQDAARLRKALRVNGRDAHIADRAYRDARLIVAALFNDEDVSTQTMRHEHGMSRRRWEWARALMRLADLTDSYYRLTVWNPLTVDNALKAARDKSIDDLSRLKRYLPRGRGRELS